MPLEREKSELDEKVSLLCIGLCLPYKENARASHLSLALSCAWVLSSLVELLIFLVLPVSYLSVGEPYNDAWLWVLRIRCKRLGSPLRFTLEISLNLFLPILFIVKMSMKQSIRFLRSYLFSFYVYEYFFLHVWVHHHMNAWYPQRPEEYFIFPETGIMASLEQQYVC